MKKIYSLFLLFFALTLISSSAKTTFAANGDVGLTGLSFANENFLEGNSNTLYINAQNFGNTNVIGLIKCSNNNNQIGTDQQVSLVAAETDRVFIDFTPYFGNNKIICQYYPWEKNLDDSSNNSISREFFAAKDTDHDGIPDDSDPDDDNDGVNDNEDAFPLNANEQFDTDGDSKGDNEDDDDDNDGIKDDQDDLPLDPDENTDTDKDGIGDNSDKDDDNDGLTDAEETNNGTNPEKADTDNDGYNDKADKFPKDPNEWLDTDNDNIGNNQDPDDDNDRKLDEEDPQPLNAAPEINLKNFSISEKDLGKDSEFNLKNIGLLKKLKLNAEESVDPDGQIKKYVWIVDNQYQFEGKNLEYKFDQLGKHQIKLILEDDQGERRSKNFQVNVTNIQLYHQVAVVFLVISLATLIYFQYIRRAKS